MESSSLGGSRSLTGIRTLRLNLQGAAAALTGKPGSQVPGRQKGGLVSAEQGEQGRDMSSRQGKEAKGEGHGQGAVDRRVVL